MKLINLYNRISSWLQKGLPYISGLLLGIAGLLMFSEVITRYFFHISHSYMEEIPRYLVVTATFLMAPVMLKLGRHINVDLVPELLKGRQKRVLTFVINCFVLSACVYMLIACVNGVIYHFNAGTVSSGELEMPIWILISTFLIGSALLVMYSIELLIRSVVALIKSEHTNNTETP